MERFECPECTNGKCVNCDGIAYDAANDQLVMCDCHKDGHRQLTVGGG